MRIGRNAWVKLPMAATGAMPDPVPATSGVNLTALNATNIASGTVADARLSTNVLLDDAGMDTAPTLVFTDETPETHTITIVGGKITDWTVV